MPCNTSRICISFGNDFHPAGGVAMAHYNSLRKVSLHCVPWGVVLAFCWCLGFIFGVFLFLYAGTPGVSLMHRMLFGSVSIVSLTGIGLLPFLFTAYAVFISRLRLLFLMCFCKACLFAFVSMGICAAFSSAGWMMRLLLLFYDTVCCVLLYFLWYRLLRGRNVSWLVIILTGILAGGLDYYIISPFLAGLIEI